MSSRSRSETYDLPTRLPVEDRVVDVLDRIGHASHALAEPTGIITNPMPDAPIAGGCRTATLNHLAGPGAVREWVALAQQEAQAIHRVRELAAGRAQLETHLALIGVPRGTLERALAEAGGLRIVPG